LREEALAQFRVFAGQNPGNAWAQYDVAVELQSLDRLAEAADAFRAAVAVDPAFLMGRHGLAHVLRRRGDRAGALAQFRAVAALAPEDLWARCDVAQELQALGHSNEARAAYRQVVARDSAFRAGHHGLALLARSLGDHGEALAHFRAVLAVDSANAWAAQDVAVELLALNRLDEAAEHFLAASGKDPRFSGAWHGLGQTARRRNDHAAALAHFRAALALEPGNFGVVVDVAAELRCLGRHQEADLELRSLIARNPESAAALLAGVEGMRARSSADEVIAWLERAASLEPAPSRAANELANACFWRGQLDRAEALFDAMLTAPEWRAGALIGKGRIARRRGWRAEALALFERAASGVPACAWAELEMANELFEAGRFAEAERVLRAGVERAPHFAAFQIQLASNAWALGDQESAAAATAAAAAAAADDEQVRIHLARAEFRDGRPEKAVGLLRAAIAENPRGVAAIEALAGLLQQLDELAEAVRLRRQALDIDPSSLWTTLQLAQDLLRMGEQAQARELMAACEARFGACAEIAAVNCASLRERGDHAAARAALDAATELHPEHFELWRQRVSFLTDAGDFAAARRAVGRPPGCSGGERARVSGLRGLIAEAEWQLDEAYACHLDALGFNPADPYANDRAARTALMRLDVAAARRHLQNSVSNNPGELARRRGLPNASQSYIGQLLDEFSLDAAVLARLKAARAGDRPVGALTRLARENPGSTSAATSLLGALFHGGMLETRGGNGGPAIPARVTQYWDRDPPADVAALCEGWRALNPDMDYRLYSNADARGFLRQTQDPDTLEAFNRAREPAMKADILRLALLHRHGGWYADADDRCLGGIAELAAAGHDLVVYREDLGTLGNNFIGAVPGHPAIGRALADAVKAINRGDTDIVWLSTGPGLLTRAVASWLAEDLPARLGSTRVLERCQLFDRVAIHCMTSYKHTNKHWSRSSFRTAGARTGDANAATALTM
jgi:tetratricopeptide (TPR) repeat protein